MPAGQQASTAFRGVGVVSWLRVKFIYPLGFFTLTNNLSNSVTEEEVEESIKQKQRFAHTGKKR